jgi:hypothetical protein
VGVFGEWVFDAYEVWSKHVISIFLALTTPPLPAWVGAGVDADFARKTIVLVSHYEKSEDRDGGSLKARIDQTNILPINESLIQDDPPISRGLWWQWHSESRLFRSYDDQLYYYLILQKDGILSPQRGGNDVLIKLIGHSKKTLKHSKRTLIFTGFCKLSPIYKFESEY